MSLHQRFHVKDLDQLRADIRRLGLRIPIDEDLSILSTPVEVAGRTIPNRFVVHPMEGFDSEKDGAPGALAFRRYERYARGGFGLVWVEATAVLNEARSNARQLYIHKGNVDVFSRLVDSMRKTAKETCGHDMVLVLQVTHSGRYSKPEGAPRPIIAHHSEVLDPQHKLPPDYPLVSDDYLDRLQDTFVEAAGLAAKAGFDGVDVKACHRYLVSELHASFTREGRYGGSFENRTRFLREVETRIRNSVKGVFITTRMNAYDAIRYPYGFGVDRADYRIPDLAEPLMLAGMLKEIGIPILNVSIGNPYFNPHYGRPFDFPIAGSATPEEHPLEGLDRFLGTTSRFQQEHQDLPVIGSGYTWLRHLVPYVAAGVLKGGGARLIGLGRCAFAYPDAPRDIMEKGKMDPDKCCVTCSACTQIMRDGAMTGCVVRDAEIYGPSYRLARRFAMDKLVAAAKLCRDCEAPTCSCACPAHVNVPSFVKAFAEGDIPKAYGILRQANALPEMCAYVCPSEVQCEGGCLEEIFCKNPVPIRDIQLVVSRVARLQGFSAVKLPKKRSGKKVAIVGAGPAGLACAITLLEKGHKVTIVDQADRYGGTPDGVIPGERYVEAKAEVDAILAPAVRAKAVEFRFGTSLGKDVTFAALRKEFDAVVIAAGLGKSTSLGDAKGVEDALAFLRQAKHGEWKTIPDSVAVIGGGNTAMDAAVTARSLGARDVYVVYRRSFREMPAWPAEREKFMNSGGHLMILTQPVGYLKDKKGNLTGLKIVRTELSDPDESGRRKPVPVQDTESVLKVGLAIEAIGQGITDELKSALKGVGFTANGLVKVAGNGSFATSLKGVYAVGDIINGGTTAVQGVAEGMQAAREIG